MQVESAQIKNICIFTYISVSFNCLQSVGAPNTRYLNIYQFIIPQSTNVSAL